LKNAGAIQNDENGEKTELGEIMMNLKQKFNDSGAKNIAN